MVFDHEASSALDLCEPIRTGNLGDFCFFFLLENGQASVGGFRMWFTKAAGDNDSPDSVSQFVLEIPHSQAALDLFPGECQKTGTFVSTEIKPSLFFCSSEEEESERRPYHSSCTKEVDVRYWEKFLH